MKLQQSWTTISKLDNEETAEYLALSSQLTLLLNTVIEDLQEYCEDEEKDLEDCKTENTEKLEVLEEIKNSFGSLNENNGNTAEYRSLSSELSTKLPQTSSSVNPMLCLL